MEPGIPVLQGIGCCLLWPASGLLSLQVSQRHDAVVRFDGLPRLQAILKDHPFATPKDSAHHFTCRGLRLELFLQWGIPITAPCTATLTPAGSVMQHLITGDYAIQETVTFNLVIVQ